MKEIMDTLAVITVTAVIALVVFVPWFSICDISKSIDRLTEQLDKLTIVMQDIDAEIHLIRKRTERTLGNEVQNE